MTTVHVTAADHNAIPVTADEEEQWRTRQPTEEIDVDAIKLERAWQRFLDNYHAAYQREKSTYMDDDDRERANLDALREAFEIALTTNGGGR